MDSCKLDMEFDVLLDVVVIVGVSADLGKVSTFLFP
jgi:hypothetical protein